MRTLPWLKRLNLKYFRTWSTEGFEVYKMVSKIYWNNECNVIYDINENNLAAIRLMEKKYNLLFDYRWMIVYQVSHYISISISCICVYVIGDITYSRSRLPKLWDRHSASQWVHASLINLCTSLQWSSEYVSSINKLVVDGVRDRWFVVSEADRLVASSTINQT